MAGNVYITDQHPTTSIYRVTTGGELELFAQVPYAAGLVTGADGNIYVLSQPFDASVLRISRRLEP